MLDEMIDARDKGRAALYELIVEYLDAVRQLPLDEKCNQIKVLQRIFDCLQ